MAKRGSQLDREIAQALARRGKSHATIADGPYRVAYGTSDGARTLRLYDPNTFTSLDVAIKRMRAYKRQGLWTWIEDTTGTFVPVEGAKSAKVQVSYPVRDAHATRKSVAYRLKLTPSELRAVEMARARYAWADMLAAHAAEDGSVAFSESEMWQWTDDVDADTSGNHSPFPMAAPALAAKLQRFYDEKI